MDQDSLPYGRVFDDVRKAKREQRPAPSNSRERKDDATNHCEGNVSAIEPLERDIPMTNEVYERLQNILKKRRTQEIPLLTITPSAPIWLTAEIYTNFTPLGGVDA